MEFYIPRTHLIMVHRQMGIELAGYPLKLAIRRGEHPARLPTGFNNDTSEIRSGSIKNIPQAPPRTTHNERRPCKVRSRHRQIDYLYFGEQRCDIQRLAKANGYIPGCCFCRTDIRESFSNLPQLI